MVDKEDDEGGTGWEDIDLSQSKHVYKEELEEIEQEISVKEEEFEEEEEVKKSEKSDEKVEKASSEKQSEIEEERVSRSAKRIQQLLEEKKKLKQELNEARKQKFETEKLSLTSEKEKLESLIKSKKLELKKAIEENDKDKELDLQEDIIKSRVKLEAVEAYSRKQPEKYEEPKEEAEKPELPEYAEAWVSNNKTWFNKDQRKTKAALAVNNALIVEGLDPQSEKFYKEVDKRLKDWYPSLFKNTNEEEDEEFDNDNEDDVNYKKSSKKRTETSSKARQVVSGGSRSPNKKFVRLSREEQDIARRMGLTNKEYAEGKVRAENPNEAGYIEIF